MSGRGAKDPRKTLTPAQRRKASMDRRAKEEKESGRRVTPAGGAGLIIGFVPGAGKTAKMGLTAAKGVYKVGNKVYKTFAAAKKANPKAKPNALVKKMQKNEAAARKMYKGPVKVKKPMSRPEKIARVAAGQGKPTNVLRTGTRRKPGLNLQDKKTGKLTGVSKKDQRIGQGIGDMAKPAARAAGVVAASAAAGDKKPAPKKVVKTTPRPVKKPTPPTRKRTAAELELIPKGSEPAAKKTVKAAPKTTTKKTEPKKLKPFEQGVRFVDTPFGKIKMDTTDKGMAFEEFDSKYGGQIKGTVKRRMGGQVRGYGKALRGY